MPLSRSSPSPAARTALEVLLTGASSRDTLRRAQWLRALDQLLRPHLPADLAPHVRLANVRGRRLVLLTDTAAWHTRLRMVTPTLIAAARALGVEVDAISIKVSPPPQLPPAAPAARVSPATRSGLQAALALLRAIDPPERRMSAERAAAARDAPPAASSPAEKS